MMLENFYLNLENLKIYIDISNSENKIVNEMNDNFNI